MKDTDFQNLTLWRVERGGLSPLNDNAENILLLEKMGAEIFLKPVTARDLSLLKHYHVFLRNIYSLMPRYFRNSIPLIHFYQWLKIYSGMYNVIYTFKDHPPLIDVQSISFAKMDNLCFKKFIAEQLPQIYELFAEVYTSDILHHKIKEVEKESRSLYYKLGL